MRRDSPILRDLLAWALSSVVLVLGALPSLDTAVDDAWISARYASQLVAGHGLVYNIGEPIEGYTNLAWTLWLALGQLFGVDMHGFMVWSGLGFGVLALGGAVALARTLSGPAARWVALAPALMAIDPHLQVASTNGLESSQFLAAVLWCSVAALRAEGRWRWPTGVALGLLGAVRPEGVAVAVLWLLVDALRHRRELRDPHTWGLALGALSALAVLLGWRWHSYGAWVPNTFAAKATRAWWRPPLLTNNLRYLGRDAPLYLGALVAGLLALRPARRLQRLPLVLLGLGLVAIAVQVELWMPASRLFLTSITVWVVAAVSALDHTRRPRLGAGLLLGWMALVAIFFNAPVRDYDAKNSPLPGNQAERAARFLAARLPVGTVVAMRDAGVFAYHLGPDLVVFETHQRALTRRHPGGRPTDLGQVRTPRVLVTTVARAKKPGPKYANDKQMFQRLPRLDYLGRVRQHYHRYYDVFTDSSLGISLLPPSATTNRAGAGQAARYQGRRLHPVGGGG